MAQNKNRKGRQKFNKKKRHQNRLLKMRKFRKACILLSIFLYWTLEPKQGMRKRASKSYKIGKQKKMKITKMINKNLERSIMEIALNAN